MKGFQWQRPWEGKGCNAFLPSLPSLPSFPPSKGSWRTPAALIDCRPRAEQPWHWQQCCDRNLTSLGAAAGAEEEAGGGGDGGLWWEEEEEKEVEEEVVEEEEEEEEEEVEEVAPAPVSFAGPSSVLPKARLEIVEQSHKSHFLSALLGPPGPKPEPM